MEIEIQKIKDVLFYRNIIDAWEHETQKNQIMVRMAHKDKNRVLTSVVTDDLAKLGYRIDYVFFGRDFVVLNLVRFK